MSESQERRIFARVKEHLLTQNCRSEGEWGEMNDCAYRGPNGLKCAVGCLISDEYYRESLEGASVRCELVIEAVQSSLGELLSPMSLVLLASLQNIHDSTEPESWKVELEILEDDLPKETQ